MIIDIENIGERIQDKINECKTSQAELSRKTGLSTTAISNYIKNNRIPKTVELYKIALELNTSMEYMITGKEQIQQLRIDEKELLELYEKLTDINKGKVIRYTEEKIEEQQKQQQDGKSSACANTEDVKQTGTA